MSFEWDPVKSESNFLKHGVHFADAVGVLEDEKALWHEDAGNREEDRYVAIGMDYLGRVLIVIFTFRHENVRLISARIATKRERETYEQQRR